MKKLLMLIIVLLYAVVANAQSGGTQFVPNRAILSGSLNATGCSECRPFILDDNRLGDGVVHLRFHDVSINTNTNKITFKMQMRKSLESQRYVTQTRVRMEYGVDAFGSDLNSPTLTPDGSSGSQCSYERSNFFTDKNEYQLFITSGPNTLALLEQHNQNANDRVESTSFGELTSQWVDFFTMTCDVTDSSQDAEIAFMSRRPEFSLGDYGVNGQPPYFTRRGFTLADNDLRGFRLDGKTWVKDYSRYGNGEGVRLEFSKSIETTLTTANFSLDTNNDSLISTVTHVANSPYAEIQFSEAIADDVLRLVSVLPNIVRDKDGEELANDNFVASLIYNSEAPRVTDITPDGNAFTLAFSSPISPATVSPDVLYLEISKI